MARIESLSILTTDEGKEYLSELYGKVIENIMKRLTSAKLKNTDLSGDPTSGSVEAKRFANAKSQKYGTARKNGAGNKVKAKPVVVAITEDGEIVEEIEEKDTRLYGVDGLLERRAENHIVTVSSELDTEFYRVAYDNAVEITIADGLAVDAELEAVIQECECTHNEFVDGVERAHMCLVLSPEYYGKVRNNLDKQSRSNVDTSEEEFYAWHGVECESSVHLPTGCKYILLVRGAVAQPVYANQYGAEKIPLSEAYGVSLFYHYGTACVTPDLIFTKATDTADDTANDETNGGN